MSSPTVTSNTACGRGFPFVGVIVIIVGLCYSIFSASSLVRKGQPETTRAKSANAEHTQLQQANTKFNSQYHLLEGTRTCRLDDPPLRLGEPNTDLATTPFFSGTGLNFRFQCAGPYYDQFMEQHLLPFIQTKQQQDSHWGTRPAIVPPAIRPPGDKKSWSILVVGNSNMRQMVVALMCQFRDQFLSTRNFEPFSTNMEVVGSQYTFAVSPTVNVTLTVLTNHPAIYSYRWNSNLEEFLQHPLDQVDAVVMGQVNPYKRGRYETTRLWQNVQNYQKAYPHHKVDPLSYPHGIELRSLLNHHKGPLVYASSFAPYDRQYFFKGSKLLEPLSRQQPAKYYTLDARQYLSTSDIQNQECTSSNNSMVVDCVKPRSSHHRCMGDKGGEPDLAAFDLVDFLWKIVSAEDRTPVQQAPPPITAASLQEANSKINSRYKLLEGTRICRIDNPHPILGQPTVDLATTPFFKKGAGLNFLYQCAGPNYDNYVEQHMLPFIQRRQQKSPHWGTRPTIVPENPSTSGKSLSILVMGNSHMRQIIVTLMCQFRDQFLSKRDFEPFSTSMQLVGSQYTFAIGPTANLTLTVLTNHPAVYSPRWKANLEEFLQHPLEQLDAVVQGQFNFYKAKYHSSKMWQQGLDYQENYPQHRVNVVSNPRAIKLRDLLNAYDGPMVYMSSFAGYAVQAFHNGTSVVEEFHKQRADTQYHSLDARQHLAEPEYNNLECTSGNKTVVADAVSAPNNHRCIGDKGGEPDLVAFDLVDALWQIFSSA